MSGLREANNKQSLKQTVTELTSAVRHTDSSQYPYFAGDFEALCQYHDVSLGNKEAGTAVGTIMPLLAGRPARPVDDSNLQNQIPSVLHKLAQLSGSSDSNTHAPAMGGTASLSLLEKIIFVDTTSLGQMEFLQAEKQALSKAVALTSHEIAMDQAKVLRQALARIALESVNLHKELFEPQSLEYMLTVLRTIEKQGWYNDWQPSNCHLEKSLQDDHYFKAFAEKALPGLISTLVAGVQNQEEDVRNAGVATIELATILLRLYVPDKPFDPSLGLVVQRKRHAQRVSELTTKSEAISSFEAGFTGQSSNMRQEILQGELRDLGAAPPPSSVTRPQNSSISLLQGEFSNLITSVLDRHPETMVTNRDAMRAQEVKLLRDNVQQLSRRLSTHYRSYDDITTPVVRLLQVLDLGMYLASSQSGEVQILKAVSEITPFLGGVIHPELTLDGVRPSPASNRVLDIRFHELSSLGVAANADSTVLQGQKGRDALCRIFEQFHYLWKTKLREDQEEQAQKSNLYQYRGSWEDEEQVDESELREMFPTYDTDVVEEGKEPNRFDPKVISRRLASLHAKLFESDDTERTLSTFVKESARLLGTLWSESKTAISPIHPKEHLPGVLLLLDDMISGEAPKYNFYTDSNLTEARKLIALTVSVQSRFIQLQTAWPDHAVIQDVILYCKDIFQFKHSEPVAKFLTKVEKLHGLVYEWQLVASREYSAASLYDELTSTIINWRRLELSTWAKLLDIEKEKCDQDVSSWWFVAYEAIIAAPLQMAESGEADMGSHIQEVIATLEQFFLSTTLGQYSERLRLVANFRSLLQLYVQDYPLLGQLVSGLQNFLEHYKPFEPLVDKLLIEKRVGLEKDIKEQIQLASWKDTNIVALRESAKRSHHKLFKLVRKYREALAGPVQPTLEQGMSDYNEEPSLASVRTESLPTAVIPEALDICQKDSALWLNRAPRFKNVNTTINNMTQLYSSMPSDFDIAEDIGNFVSYVIEGINDFKSQTPKMLTEDNKEDVQHLKIQKRRFFADTLRQILEMGIKRNASTSLLESQASSAQVLATTDTLEISPVSSHLIHNANSYFHRFLDLLPRTRQASRHYSEELSNVEASRGMGSIEHLLFTLRKQRGVISPALSNLSSFKSTIAKVSNLWQSGLKSLSASQYPTESQDLSKIVAWLTPILGMAAEIVDVHSRFSGIDAAVISKDLRAWKATSDYLHKSLVNLPALPFSVSSQQHQALIEESWSSLNQLTVDLAKWTSERPDLSFALDQITPWINTKTDSNMQQNGTMALAVQDFDANLLNGVDKILVGLQKLKEVPAALTSEGTLARSDEFFSRTIKSVRLSEITSSLESVLDTLHSGADIPYASALIASVLPIMNKYYLICEDLTDRFISVHRETCKMSYVLAKSFMTIASEGFCQPAEASTGEESKSGQLESGTGLGDGEGAEDISKDVADDEDLSELAQQQNEEAKEDQEDSGDAVNMDQEEMQGESGERKEEEDEENESGEEGDDDIDEEVGSVNDLDTDALDEKMWDGERDEQQKETETQEGKGATESEEQTAGEKEQEQKDQEQKDQEKGEKSKEGEEEEEEEDEEEEDPDDEGEAVGREDLDVTDPHAKEEEALDLPEEMQLDGEDQGDKDEGEDDDGMDELSDMGAAPEEEQTEQQGENAEEDAADMDQTTEEQGEEGGENEEEKPEEAEANEAEGDDEANAPGEDEEQPEETDFLAQRDENEAAGEEVAPSEAVNGGLGADQDQNQDKGASGDAQQKDGAADPANTEQQTGAAQDGEDSKRSRDAGGADDNTESEKPEMQAFKKMGDILEQWHRRQKEIMESSKQEDETEQQLPEDTDMADADFEHLADQDDVADTQALGQANEEQAKALDQNKGVESDVKPNDEALPDVSNDQQEDPPENQLEDEMQVDNDAIPTEREGAGAMIPGNAQTQERTTESLGQQDLNEELDEMDSHLAAIHLSSTLPPLTPRDEAQRLWSQYESATNDLSLSLTEQLRLILAPTLATKLRGDFRTGKRLNIKRIIPYIASQYKRDKIWMRRSIPSKRNYQIMLAVDDSKSMLESGSGQLAFETLALVAKSLSMLEAGDLCVLGFGNEDHVRVAHDFGKPFSSDAGTEVFQHFSYQQTGTNVRKLIADSIALFREARFKRSPGSGSADLWQLELIISDGICEDHDTIRRLVRQALEERIMVVFIIVDAVKGSSILDLSQASFEPDAESGTGEMKLKMKRYLEGFPFPYYLVVRDVRELPAVLATALKQWFAEVVDVSS